MLVAVGGHSRNVGKTSTVCGIIAATRHLQWVAVKITQHGHGLCSLDGKPCDCAPENPEHPYVLDEQMAADRTDSGRYWGAGAAKSYWLRTAMGDLGHALPALERLLGDHANVILESNSVLEFLKPDLYVAVLDPATADFKDSARRFLKRADALYCKSPLCGPIPWAGVEGRWLEGKPRFESMEELGAYVGARVEAALHSGHGQARHTSDAAADGGVDAGLRSRP
ncbi:MAG: hypothetical protein JNK48_29830 [Bryobacterales bacterium]|nr:hypothetical protein [Bryobacterales bacterium]